MLHEKINDLKHRIMEMAAHVEKMLSLAFIDAAGNDGEQFEEVCKLEKKVNAFEVEIDETCVMLIALYHPEARDLRNILMMYRLNNDLERLGDQAVNIGESYVELIGNPISLDLPELKNMRTITLSMLSQAVKAFASYDAESARDVCKQDEIVDNFNRDIINKLILLIKEDSMNIQSYLHLLRIAKNLERIADLSTNVAENTIYLVQGKVIKHYSDTIDTE